MQLTTEDRGLWYDPAQTGTGFEIRVLEDGRFMGEFFCGRVSGWFNHAVWLSIQGTPDADGKLPLLLTTGAVLGQPHDLALAQCGTVRLDKIDDSHIRAVVDITGNGRDVFSPPPPPVRTVFELRRLVV